MKIVQLALAGFILFCPFTAFAAISFDAHAGTGLTTGTQHTFNATVAAGATAMFVCVEMEGAVDQATSTSVNYNGIVASKLATVQRTHTSGGQTMDEYELLSPTSGTHAVTVSYTASVSNLIMENSYLGSTVSGVSGNTITNSSITQALALTTTVATANAWLVGCASDNIDQVTVTSGGIIRENSGNVARATFDSNAAEPTGSFTTNLTQPSADPNEMYVGTLAELDLPSVAAPKRPFNPFLLFFGRWSL